MNLSDKDSLIREEDDLVASRPLIGNYIILLFWFIHINIIIGIRFSYIFLSKDLFISPTNNY